MIELRRLRAFVTVVEEGNITRAAERLFIQQPPLTRLLQGLEDELGVKLLQRLPRGVRVTEAGDVLFEEARALLARARAEFVRAEATFEAQRQNATEAEEAFRIASLRFERGLGTQLEVTDAQLSLFTARVNAARATIDYYLAAAELAGFAPACIPGAGAERSPRRASDASCSPSRRTSCIVSTSSIRCSTTW